MGTALLNGIRLYIGKLTGGLLKDAVCVFPIDVIRMVLGYCRIVDVVRCMGVCRAWRECGGTAHHEIWEWFREWELAAGTVRWGIRVSPPARPDVFKVTVVGVRGTGAATLTTVLSTGVPESGEEHFHCHLPVWVTAPNHPIGKLQLWCSLLSISSRSLGPPPAYQHSSLHLLCYDASSYSHFAEFISELRYYIAKDIKVPCILVGTRCDLPPNELAADLAHILSQALGIPHVKTSARTLAGIDKLMQLIKGQSAVSTTPTESGERKRELMSLPNAPRALTVCCAQ